MEIDTKTVNDILKRIKAYCEDNYSCEACPFLSLDVETSSRLDIPCTLKFEFEPHHKIKLRMQDSACNSHNYLCMCS